MKTLLMTVGLPRSGKSSWAARQGLPIACPDDIRVEMHGDRSIVWREEPEVWARVQAKLAEAWRAGHERAILDSTNTTMKARAKWCGPYRREMVTFPTPTATCMRRARRDGHTELEALIERMSMKLEWPTKLEAHIVRNGLLDHP